MRKDWKIYGLLTFMVVAFVPLWMQGAKPQTTEGAHPEPATQTNSKIEVAGNLQTVGAAVGVEPEFEDRIMDSVVNQIDQEPEAFEIDAATWHDPSGFERASLSLRQLHDTGEGAIVAEIQQIFGGLPVFNQRLSAVFDRQMTLLLLQGRLHSAQVRTPAGSILRLDPQTAIAFGDQVDVRGAIRRAYQAKTGLTAEATLSPDARVDGEYVIFKAELREQVRGPQLLGEQRVRKVLYPSGPALEPAYYVELNVAKAGEQDSEMESYIVSSLTGQILFQNSLRAAHTFRVPVQADQQTPAKGPLADQDSLVFERTAGNRVAPGVLVTQEQGFHSRRDAWLAPESRTIEGNNVLAYSDIYGTDGYQPRAGDHTAEATASGFFDYPLSVNPDPNRLQDRKAALVNMFYVLNYLHNWFYDSGFNEASGNAQRNNFNRGGRGNDPIRAEGQDTLFYRNEAQRQKNNANMSTPADGASPRMQMYVFNRNTVNLLIDGQEFGAGSASFGPANFQVEGNAIRPQDQGGTDPFDACEPIAAGSLTGRIAIAARGQCSFAQKALNAQAAGARGLVVVNNGPGLFQMSGTDPQVTIPLLAITRTEGGAIQSRLDAGQTVSLRLTKQSQTDRDGTLDNAIIAHEWGHYLSNRLVCNANGLSNSQGRSMGEGWSDFVAMLLLLQEEDRRLAGNDSYQGRYVISGFVKNDGYGLRRLPYSTDQRINALSFRHITRGVALPTENAIDPFSLDAALNAEYHNAGEIWANTLWEVYAALLNDSPRLSFAEAQRRMRAYLVASLKATPCQPTFIEARDALLAVMRADPQDYRLAAAAFTKRGMGQGARAPSRTDTGYSTDAAGTDIGQGHAGVRESFQAFP